MSPPQHCERRGRRTQHGNTLHPGCLRRHRPHLRLHGAVMAADDKLIIMGDKGELVVAKASTAGFNPLARAQVLGGKCWTTPVLANGKIYCRNAKGDLVCLDVKK